jgi:uncharacterized protein YecT (DUF1311 family)
MYWADIIKDAGLLLLGGIGTAVWFFLRRKIEQKPVFENIQKAERLLSLRKDLDNKNVTLEDLKKFENELMGRAVIAEELSISYAHEAQQIREIDSTHMTQSEMNLVAFQSYQNAEQKLDDLIEQLKSFFSSKQSDHFDKVNEAWRRYLKIHADFEASKFEGGSIQPLIHASSLETATIARIVELESELKFIKDI